MTLTTEALTPEQEAAAASLAAYFGTQAAVVNKPGIVEWAETQYHIPETGRPIQLEPVQKTFLRFAFEHKSLRFTTIVYSTIKKSGKTAISGLVGRYKAEFSGNKAEVYFIANDKEQAKDRAHEAAITSIELTPGYNKSRRELPGKWRIIQKEAVFGPNDSKMQAIASDYESAAGGNPTITLWTELWGFKSERMTRLWDEMTPVPTRLSQRYVETYAGFTDESIILLDLYKVTVTSPAVRRVTREELEPYGGWPYADEPPFYVNESARSFAYWDQNEVARRMPWQRGPEADAYYREQETSLRPDAFKRLHLNLWVSSLSEFIPLVWWTRCKLAEPLLFARDYPVVIGVDASVSGDCTAVVGVSRDPRDPENKVVLRFCRVWRPPVHGTIDYADVKSTIVELCDQYNIVQCAYDAYQLHQMMQELTREGVVWCKSFSQASDREIADKMLYDLIRDRKISHHGEIADEFINNAAAYVQGDTAKIDRLRIVKKAKDKPVDPLVAKSMAVHECRRLIL